MSSIELLLQAHDVIVNTGDGGFWAANFPDWLAGVGTVATAGVSVFLLWREREDRERQRAREALADDTARRAQAAQVNLDLPHHGDNQGITNKHWDISFVSSLKNGSPETINDVVVTCVALNPDGTEAIRHTSTTARVLPGASATVTTAKTRLPWIESVQDYNTWSEAEFTDAAGVRWRRDAQHRLSEISPPMPKAKAKGS